MVFDLIVLTGCALELLHNTKLAKMILVITQLLDRVYKFGFKVNESVAIVNYWNYNFDTG